ncbi:MAG: RNA polymerase sigma factor [Pseudonocardiaceae bacterium]
MCALRGFTSKSCPALTSGASGGDLLPEDFAAFHDAHRVNLLKYVRFRGISFHDAEDVVNEVFLTLYRIRARLRSSDNLEAFAFKVVKDTVVDFYRKNDRQPITAGIIDDNLPGINRGQSHGDVEGLIIRLDLQRELDLLPTRQAECMGLYALLDQDILTVARYLDITPSAVTSHLHLARRRLTERLATIAAEEGTP